MTVHPLFTPARPALAPILFPRILDGLLYSRKQTIRLATYAVHQTRHQFRPAALIDWSRRLDARIAQVAK